MHVPATFNCVTFVSSHAPSQSHWIYYTIDCIGKSYTIYDYTMASFKESAQSLLSEVTGVLFRRSSGDSKDEPESGRHQEVCHDAVVVSCNPDVGKV